MVLVCPLPLPQITLWSSQVQLEPLGFLYLTEADIYHESNGGLLSSYLISMQHNSFTGDEHKRRIHMPRRFCSSGESVPFFFYCLTQSS